MAISGVYEIRNTKTNKVYYGSSTRIKKRWGSHRSRLNRGQHRNKYLQCAWDKYGEGSFEFKLLKEVSREKLLIEEQKLLDSVKDGKGFDFSKTYNIQLCAGDNSGYVFTKDDRAKMRLAHTNLVEQDWLNMLIDYKNELTYEELEKKYKISSKTIIKNLRRLGHEPNRLHKPKYNSVGKRKIAEYYLKGHTTRETATKFNITNGTVSLYLKELGISTRSRRDKLSKDDVILIKEKYQTGEYTQAKLGQMFGVSRSAIGLIVRGINYKGIKI